MKIIRPLELTSGQISSNAPADNFPEWQAVGREILESIPDPVMAAYGDTLYYINGSSQADVSVQRDIGVQDLVTGNIQAPFVSIIGVGKAMAVSPDGAWLAIIREESSGYYINVFDVQTAQAVYSSEVYCSNSRPLLAWSSASDYLAFTYSTVDSNDLGLCARIVSSATWSSPQRTETVSSLAGHSSTQAQTIDSLDWDDSGSLFLTGVSIVNLFSGPYSCRLAKFSALAATQANIELSDIAFNFKMGINRARGEVIVLGTNFQLLYDTLDLSVVSTPAGLQFKAEMFGRSVDDAELLFKAVGTSPKYRRFDASNYSALAPLPVEPDFHIATYADDYVLFPRDIGGYLIVDRTTNELIELINPQVVTGDTYIYQDKVWEALVDNQDRPDTGSILEPPTWVSLGAINPLRLADGQVGTFTSADGPLEVIFSNVDIVDGIALFNLLAQTITIELVDDVEGLVFTTGEISLVDNAGVSDWYQYFYSPITNRNDFVFTALPPYRGADVRVVLGDVSGVLQVGEVALGPIRNLGDTEYGTNVGILDFSRKDRDTFGNFVITERRFSKRANYDISLRTNQIAFAQQLLAAMRAIPAVYIGAESQPETIIYGFYRSFDIVLRGPVYSDCTIEVEGLT